MGAMSAPEVAAPRLPRHDGAARPIAIPGVRNKLSLQAQRVSPRSAVLGVAARLNQIVG